MIVRYLLLCLLLIVALGGCETEPKKPVDEYHQYFPLRLNRPLVYQVTETRYAAATQPATASWQEKDEIVRLSESSDGYPLFIYSRWKRNTPADPWQKVKEYSVVRYPDKYLHSMDNVTTVPVIFPVSYRATWDMNFHNDREMEICTYDYIGRELTIGELSFPNTIQVSGRNHTDDDIVKYNLGYSQYAFGVGLIYEEQTDYEYCQEAHCFGEKIISSGVSTIRQIIEYQDE